MKKRGGNKGQVSFEYMVIIGFVTLAVVIILGLAMIYSGSIRDKMRTTQMENCINKIISSAESVFYAGEPSIATITCYLPENVKEISVYSGVLEKGILVKIGTSSGEISRLFTSNVNLSGTLISSPGIRKIKIEALGDSARLSPA